MLRTKAYGQIHYSSPMTHINQLSKKVTTLTCKSIKPASIVDHDYFKHLHLTYFFEGV